MIEIRQSRNGVGVFANTPIERGVVIWDFSACKRYTAAEIPTPYVKDEYLQVADDVYLGPDGSPPDAGDYVNHSCAANAALAVLRVGLPDDIVILVASRDIAPGEEISYDYALTMKNDPWTMNCNCGTSACRGLIQELKPSSKAPSRR